MSSGTIAIWDGVYASFDEAAAAVAGPGFDGETWRSRSLAAATECLTALEAGRPIPHLHKQRSVLLPSIVAAMLGAGERLRILDFGGGLGIGFLTLLESIPRARARIDYTIVELPHITAEGRRLHADRVRYVEALPRGEQFDLVHASSALQYVEDWQQLLISLGGYGARFMLLSDIFAGRIPSFVTLQHYYGSRIRHWFWNLDELLAACERAGYALAMKSFAAARRGGVDDVLPMDQFPESHRLDQSLHLLLSRRT
jgi:putative methyltransferase (TIGR04325 family)